MNPRDPVYGRRVALGGLGGPWGAPPRDLLIIIGTLFVTFTLQFFDATRIVPELLRLTPLAWRLGFVWQLLTYPFVGYGSPSIWILVELLILFMFGRDVYAGLGRKHFWRLLLITSALAGAVALLVQGLQEGGENLLPPPAYFPLLQGQRVLLAILVAAFATANRRATIMLFFVLPIEARYFLGLEILFAFVAFLATHDPRDLGGFLGICAAVGLAYLYVRDGGFGRGLRQTRLRAERWWLQRKLDVAKRRRGLRVIKGQGDGARGPWLH